MTSMSTSLIWQTRSPVWSPLNSPAATMAGREVHSEVMAIIARMRLIEGDVQ